MRVIVIASQKGGAGKSTLSAHIAVQAVREGQKGVMLIDTDPQGSLTAWHEARRAEEPGRLELEFDAIPAGLQVLRERGAGLVVIDTAPSRSESNRALFRLADLVVIPVRPSPADLWAVSATVEQLKADNVPFVFVLNAIKSAASITAQAAAALSHHGRVAQTFVADRTAYAAAMVDGSAAQELQPRGPAAREMAELLANIKACMHANMKG